MMNLEEIKAREQAATPGPWNRIEHKHGRLYVGTNEKPIADICNLYHTESEANLAFISHARTDIPELIAEVERLAAQLNEEVSRRYQAECNYDHAVKDRDMLKKALELAMDIAMPNSSYSVKQAIMWNLIEQCERQQAQQTHGNETQGEAEKC